MIGSEPEKRKPHAHHSDLETNRKGLWIAIAVTGVVMVIEAIGGILANSLALFSDAGHMLTDIMSLLLSLVALQLATRTPSSTRTYGLYRMEILAALVNGTTLILISLYILYEAYQRFASSQVVNSRTMLFVATVGLIANGVAALAMSRANRENLNLKGAYLHILGDMLSSVGVIVGALIITFTHWYVVDPIISVLICLLIFRGAFGLVRDSVNILLEAVPRDVSLEEVERSLRSIAGVKDLHHLHLWTITSSIHALSAHVLVDDILMSRTGQILQEINRILKERYSISHTTIQFECQNCEEGFYCSLDRMCVAMTRKAEGGE
jgi:cobalt-zinc-cadmium efflux system protein